MYVYCHICGKRLIRRDKRNFSRDIILTYMTSKDRVSTHEESDLCCRSCGVDVDRFIGTSEQYRDTADTFNEESSSQSSSSTSQSSSNSQASSSASFSTSFSDSSVDSELDEPGPSQRGKRRRSEFPVQTLPTMVEEEEPLVTTNKFYRLEKRRSCLYGCAWTRASDLRFLTADERYQLLQDQLIYTVHDTYICKSHLETEEPRTINAEDLTHSFTVSQLEDAITLSITASVGKLFRDGVPVADKKCKRWTGLKYGQFSDLCSSITVKCTRKVTLPVAVYLAKLRTGDTVERIADIFCISLSSANNYMNLARQALLEEFVPRNLGFNHIDRSTALSHITPISKALFNVDADEENKMICVADGTYIYHQKSFHHSFQRCSYSPHKYRNLFKPMMLVAPDGYIIDVEGPYSAKSNDASIFEDIIRGTEFSEFFTRGDIFILDRGFRNCLPSLQNKGYRYRTPEFCRPNQQLTCEQANRSRLVTKVRWIVEDVNGKIESKFRAFDKVWPNTALDHAYDDFRVACAIHNRYGKRFETDRDSETLASVMQQRMRSQNKLIDFVQGFERWNSRSWVTIDEESLPDFPIYTERDLYMLTLGSYQLKMAEGYYLEHASPDGRFIIQVQRQPESLTQSSEQLGMDDPVLIRARIQSRHSNATKYIVLICYDKVNRCRLLHYCQCKNGARTIGCCAHTATLIWYLGWARKQDSFHTPSIPMTLLETHNWSDEED